MQFRRNQVTVGGIGGQGDNAGAVQDAPYNLISAFHLPRASAAQLSGLSRAYPNVSLLDIDAILQRVREVI